MLDNDIRRQIYYEMPSQFTIKGIEFKVPKRYANQFFAEVFPAIVLQYTEYDNVIFEPLTGLRLKTGHSTDAITFETGVTIYNLQVVPVRKILRVVGKVGGVTYEFKQEEFALVNSDKIQFLGPTFPDDGSEVLITYSHKWVRQFQGCEIYDNLSVNVYAQDYKYNGKTLNGILIAEHIANVIKHWLKYSLDIPGVVVRQVSELRDLDVLTQQPIIRRRQFDARVVYTETVETRVETVEEVEWTITLGG